MDPNLPSDVPAALVETARASYKRRYQAPDCFARFYRHKRDDLNVPPDWYPDFAGARTETVGEHYNQYSDDIAEERRTTVSPGLEWMKAQYWL